MSRSNAGAATTSRGFQIPMRGNEMAYQFKRKVDALVSNPHEG